METYLAKEEKEYVYIPKSLAAKIKDLQDGKMLEAMIISYIEESKKYLKVDIESMEDSILQYRAFMSKAKNAFREAKEEQLNAAYELWEKFEIDMKGLRSYVDRAKKECEPLINELRSLKAMMNEVDSYDLSRFLSVVQAIPTYGEGFEMLKFLLANYKKPNSEQNVQVSDTTESASNSNAD